MSLPGWLKKQPQQGTGKCGSKHSSSRHSRALLGRGPQAGRGTRGSRGRSPASAERHREVAWPVLGDSWPSPQRSRLPKAFCSPCWSSCGVLTVHVSPGGGPTPGFLFRPPTMLGHCVQRSTSRTAMDYGGASPWLKTGNGAGGISQNSLPRDGFRAAPQQARVQGCGLGDRQ